MPRIHGSSIRELRRGIDFVENDLSTAAREVIFNESKLIKRSERPRPQPKAAHIGHPKGSDADTPSFSVPRHAPEGQTASKIFLRGGRSP